MILSKLTPAETLTVWKGKDATLQDLLKYTLLDLLLKQVLAIREVQRQPNKRDPIRTYKYVSDGKNFQGYACLPHELVYLSPFQKSSGLSILFRHIVKIGYENAESEKSFKRTLISSPELSRAFSVSLLQNLIGGITYTGEGLILKRQVEIEIESLEKTLPEMITNNKGKALEVLKVIGGNVFLLKGLEFALVKEIDDELLKELSKQQTSGGCSTGCWTAFETYGHDFDSSCSADTPSGCSGGDSGCGGCGSCGSD